MDWIRLGNTKDLAGTGGKFRPVSTSELACHNKVNDAWMCIHGKVYNVTDYMEYHPGGIPELMRGAGIDATDLFMEVHRWVNFESMLKPCLIGPLVDAVKAAPKKSSKLSTLPSLLSSMQPPPATAPPQGPSFDWFQTDSKISAVFYTKWKSMIRENVILEFSDDLNAMTVKLILESSIYTAVLSFDGNYVGECQVSVNDRNGRVEIELSKEANAPMWQSVKVIKASTFDKTLPEINYMQCHVRRVQKVTHDTFLFCIALPAHFRMTVPIGHHVTVKGKVLDVEITNQYTVVSDTLLETSEEQLQGKCINLMIKCYPDGALTSSCISNLKPRDSILISDLHQGSFMTSQVGNSSFVLLFAAGSGFTPMVRLIQHLLRKLNDVSVKLIFFNKTEADILWHDQLTVATERCKNFSVVHILSQADAAWKGLTGRVSRKLVEEAAPEVTRHTSNVFSAVCGPLVFTNTCVEILRTVGVSNSNIHAFKG